VTPPGSGGAADTAALVGLAVFIVIVVAERIGELAWSARTARRLAARGGREVAAAHFPLLVALHVLYPLVLIAEVVWLGARPSSWWPMWLVLWLGAQALRFAAIHALGDRWNVRIWTVPGEPRVRRGLYRWLRHPNYLAVIIELMAGPMLFGAWRTAFAISTLNALALRVRIRAEEAALAEAEGVRVN